MYHIFQSICTFQLSYLLSLLFICFFIYRYEAEVQKDGVINQINNPEVTVDVNEANYIIEQQKIQLKIITDKLQTAYKGGDVTYIYTGNN